MWYASHLILYLQFQDGVQDKHLVWENIYIFQANTVDKAYQESDRIGNFLQISDTGKHTYENRPVRWKYAGVRRLAECIDFEGGSPESGKEVTYLSYFLENEASLAPLLSKMPISLILEGDD